MDANVTEGVLYAQPKTYNERKIVAGSCSTKLNLSMPVLVDEIDNRVDNLYAGWPERIFIVDRNGAIAYAGKQGPFGFKPHEAREWLEKNVGQPK
jgi:hypothetical protein